MKKALTLLTALLMLVSCTADPVADTPSPADPPSSDSTEAPSAVDFEGYSGTLPVSLPCIGSLSGFALGGRGNAYISYPIIYTAGDGIYAFADNGQILKYTDPSAEPVVSAELSDLPGDAAPLAFAVYEDEILLVTNCIEDNAAYRYDRDGNLLQSAPFSSHRWFCEFMPAFVGEDLYYLAQDGVDNTTETYSTGPAERTLYRTNPWTGDSVTIGENVCAYCVSDGVVYFVEERMTDSFQQEYILCRYHPEDSAISEEAVLNLPTRITRPLNSVIGYDSANRILYYQFSGATFACLISADEIRQISRNSLHFTVSGGIFAMDTRSGSLELYEASADPVDFTDLMPTLKIASITPDGVFNPLAYDDALMILAEKDMHLAVDEAFTGSDTAPDEYAFTMAKKLLAGDTDFDIFMVTTEMFTLMKEAYYEDLSGYAVLTPYFDAMLPGMTNICTVDSTLALIPTKLSFDMMTADDSLTSESAELPGTFDAFPAFIDRIAPTLTEGAYFMIPPNSYIFFRPWFRQFASNYLWGGMDDDTALQDLTELYRCIHEILSHPSVDSEAWETGKAYLKLNVSVMKRSKKIPRDTRMVSVPPMKEGYRQAVSGTFFAVNPLSPRKEEAAEFLAALLETELRDSETLVFDVWDPYAAYQAGAEELFASMKAVVQNGLRSCDIPDLFPRLAEQFARMDSGTLTPDEAAEELFRYIRMVKNE